MTANDLNKFFTLRPACMKAFIAKDIGVSAQVLKHWRMGVTPIPDDKVPAIRRVFKKYGVVL
jgi:DNA-binding transcriptional regulator YdaS (Cro superfamily)